MTPPPLPGEPGYNPQRMTVHRPAGGRRGPTENRAAAVCDCGKVHRCHNVRPDEGAGLGFMCMLAEGHDAPFHAWWSLTRPRTESALDSLITWEVEDAQ